VKKYTAGCADRDWDGEFDSVEEQRAAARKHHEQTGHPLIGYGTVPDDILAMANQEEP